MAGKKSRAARPEYPHALTLTWFIWVWEVGAGVQGMIALSAGTCIAAIPVGGGGF